MREPHDVQSRLNTDAGSEAGFSRLRAAIQRKERLRNAVRVVLLIGGILIFLWMLNSL